MKDNNMGLIHLYCGEGKGKTTAAIGLSVRAAGSGRKVIFAQFMKGAKSGEVDILRLLPLVSVMRSQKDFPFYSKMSNEQKEEITQIHNGILQDIMTYVTSEDGQVDMIVLDEITYPIKWNLIDIDLLHTLIDSCAGRVEVIMTGREMMDQKLLDQADYITRMECVRHPYENGILAREGVEY